MINTKFWELASLERGLNLDSDETLYDIFRTLKIKEALKGEIAKDPYEALEILKKVDAPYIKGDEKLFYEVYKRINEMSNRTLVEYVCFVLSQERTSVIVPDFLFPLMFKHVSDAETVFVNDCDKYGVELYDLISANKNTTFYLTVKNDILSKLLPILYKDENVEFISPEIYTDAFTLKKFDLIVSFPIMGGRELNSSGDFISRELSFIAAQNLLYHLTTSGKLVILLPAKIGFGGGDAEVLRHYISENYKVDEISSLPSRVFYPYMSINTYLLTISTGTTENICVKKYDLDDKKLIEKDTRLIFSDELEELNAWNVDMVFSVTDETVLAYKNSTVKKAHINEVAEVFRGKAITEKAEGGNVSVVNISNISDIGIDYANLETINEEERKVARYLLQDGDVLITTKGFSIKVAVFEKQPIMCIASSNLCVIRTQSRLLNGTYLKLFLESEVGIKLLKSLQRGTTIVNINYQDICQLEVPVPLLDDQIEVVNEYKQGLSLYVKTISAAESAWKAIKADVQKKLF